MTWRWDEGVYTVTASIAEFRQGRELVWDLTYNDGGKAAGFKTNQAIDDFVMVGPPKINWLAKPVPDEVLRAVAAGTKRRWPVWLASFGGEWLTRAAFRVQVRSAEMAQRVPRR